MKPISLLNLGGIVILSIFMSLSSLKADEIPWPSTLLPKVDKLIEIQRNVRLASLDVNHSPANHRKEREDFDRRLMELGSLPELQALKPMLQREEAKDLRAKLTLIAMDFAVNQEVYQLIGALYFYYPRSPQEMREFTKADNPEAPDDRLSNLELFRRINIAMPVKVEHLKEAYRLAFEYHLLAPLHRSIFGGGWLTVRRALALIGNPATVTTYIELAQSCPDNIRSGGDRMIPQVLKGLCDFPSLETLDAMANLTEVNKVGNDASALRVLALEFIGGTWGNYGMDQATFDRDAQLYKEWQALVASLPSLPSGEGSPQRQSLAKAIAALPQPPKDNPEHKFEPRNVPIK